MEIRIVEAIEQIDKWRSRFAGWQQRHSASAGNGIGDDYPFVENVRARFTPARRALSMINLALITSAGAYIDGADPFDVNAPGGDVTFREIPREVEVVDLRFASRGYEPVFVSQDPNVQIPLDRLFEFEANRVIGKVNSAFWSFSGFIPHAGRMVDQILPRLVAQFQRYVVHAS